MVQAILFTFSAAAFLAWFFRAYANLPALGATDLRFRRGWAIGAWFVPILNLWRPKQIANDIWRASDPDNDPDQGPTWRVNHVPFLFAIWWISFLVSQQLYRVAFRRSVGGETVDELQTATTVTIVADLISILAAALAIVYVLRTTTRQESRAANLNASVRDIEIPLYRRRSTWAAGVAVAAALLLQGGLAAVIWSLDASSDADAGSVPEPSTEPGVLLRDDFARDDGGWPVETAAAASVGYVAGSYRIAVRRRNYEQQIFRAIASADGVEITTSARLHSSSRLDGFGVGCWESTESGYYGVVYGDGVYAIVKASSARNQPRALTRGSRKPDEVVRGGGKPTELRFRCFSAGRPGATIILWANGRRIAIARDRAAAFPRFSVVGLVASSLTGRTVVRFDGIEARRVTGG